MNIIYCTEFIATPEQVIELYENSGLPRPTNDREKIEKMFKNSNLVVTAWDIDLLVGVPRSITEYLS